MDWPIVAEKIFVPLVIGLLAFIGGRAHARKTNIEGAILTVDKINELLGKLMQAKEEMIGLKSQLADLSRDSKELQDLKQKILVICEEVETDTNLAITMLRSLKKRMNVDER